MSWFFDALGRTFSPDGFMPRRICGLWPEWLVWEHIVGNGLVWISYMMVPLLIWRLGNRMTDWAPFKGLSRNFACFIGLCGLGHFLDMLAFYRPMYRFSGHVLILTGVVSWWTVRSLRRALPALMALKSPAELDRLVAERTEELSRAIEALKRADADRARLATIVESSDDAIIGKDLDGIITSWNAGAERIFGYPAEEAVGRPIMFLIPPDRVREESAILSKLRAGERLEPFEAIRVVKDGRLIDVSLTVSPIKDRLGRIIGISKIARDITASKKAEAALRESEERQRRALSAARLAHWEWDVDTDRVISHGGLEVLYGSTEDRPFRTSRDFIEAVHPEDQDWLADTFQRCVREGIPYEAEYRVAWPDGSVRWLAAKGGVFRNEDGRVVRMAGINIDITEKKAAEAIRLSEERFRGAFDASAIGMAIVSPDGRWLQVNRSLCKIIGFDEGELLEMSFQDITHPDDLEGDLGLLRRLVDGEISSYQMEKRYFHKNGHVVWIILSVSVVRDGEDQPLHFVSQIEDITARKRAEEELRHARDKAMEATRAKGNFLANMSHEIRTPMSGVIGMTELLLDTKLNDLQRDYAETIRGSGEALLTVINDILDFSKIEAGKLTLESAEFDLRTLMEEVADLLAPRVYQKGLEINTRVDSKVPARLLGDPVRVRQLLTNLAGNAVKFTDRGEVNLEASFISEDEDRVTLRIAVRDTGIGIPEDRQADVFESFSQVEGSSNRRYGGTGLGLAICRSLVDLMGGRIGLVSTPGEGSLFWIEMSLNKSTSELLATTENIVGLRVLIVFDHETNRTIASEALLSWQCRPDVVGSGAEALAKLLASSDDDPYHLVLLDRQMPGMDGMLTAKVIKGSPRFAAVPIVIVTSPGAIGTDEEFEDGLFAASLMKPIRRSALYNAICRAGATSAPGRSQMTVEVGVGENPLKLRVLLAEDNDVNRKVATGLAERLGCQVDAVENGREALALLDYDLHDLVLMDVQMPEMDGFTATAAIREREAETGQHIPIIAMTAHAMQGDRERCLAAGMDGYLSKPLRPGAFREMLIKWGVEERGPAIEAEMTLPSREPSRLADSLMETCGQDSGFITEVVGMMLKDTPARLERMKVAIERMDGQQVSWEAHSLKGVFLTVGARTLSSACQELDKLGKLGDFDSIISIYPGVLDQWETLKDEVTTYLATLPGGNHEKTLNDR